VSAPPAKIDNPLNGIFQTSFAPVFQREVVRHAAHYSSAIEFCGYRMSSRLRRTPVLANHDLPVIMALHFRSRRPGQTNKAKPAQHALRAEMLS
jgi:hypothetical protein